MVEFTNPFAHTNNRIHGTITQEATCFGDDRKIPVLKW